MSIAAFLSNLREQGIELRAENNNLVADAPKGALTADLGTQIRERKAEILAFLVEANALNSAMLPPLHPINRNGSCPLSFAQERLWRLAQLDPDSATYHIPAVVRLHGPLNVAALEESLTEILRRHEMLRTTFVDGSDQARQLIAAPTPYQLTRISVENFPANERETAALNQSKVEVARPFDLANEPLFRATLIDIGPADHILIVVMHHLISDGWSFGVFMQELEQLYTAFSTAKPSPLADLPVQYGDYVFWQRDWFQGDQVQQQLAYWTEQLSGPVAPLQLPLSQNHSAEQSHQGASYTFSLCQPLTQQLTALSRELGTTLSTTLLAAFKLLLHSYSGQTDVVVCSPIAGRTQAEVEGLIGYFNNILVLRSDLATAENFRQLVGQVKQVVTEAYNNQDTPFQTIADLPALKRVPLSRALYDFQNEAEWSLNLPQLQTETLELETQAADFDLALFIEENDHTLNGRFEYKTHLFKAADIEQLGHTFEALLTTITKDDQQPFADLPVYQQLASFRAQVAANPTEDIGRSTSPNTAIGQTPIDGIELQLTKIWERVLDMAPIGLDDNFFDLGGHSLLAVSLFEQVEQALQKRLPLATLFQAPTIRKLAAFIRSHDDSAGWSSLVPIQPQGTRPPLFFVHAAGGNVLIYRDLAHKLGADQPVYGLQSQGLDGKQPFLTTAEAMAERYIREIKVIQPAGPYHLGGYCAGGTIAYEMAQQLYKQGDEVETLALFETYNWINVPEESTWDTLYYWLQKYEFHIRNFLLLDLKGMFTFLAEKMKVVQNRRKVWQGRFLSKFGVKSNTEGDQSLLLAKLWQINDDAGDNYAPAPYPGQIAFFQPRKEYALMTGPEAGWETLAAKGVKTYRVSAFPAGMLVEPFVDEVAVALKEILNESQD